MEDETNVTANSMQYSSARIMSPEIVEIGEDSRSITASRDVSADVYVAVGKDDLDVLKWALEHAVSPGTRVFLVHVFPPITYIPTPVSPFLLKQVERLFNSLAFTSDAKASVEMYLTVGRLSRSQLSQEQVRVYINEENNRRRNKLQKYIRLCTNAKVPVDTMLIESDVTAKSILDLIPVLNITNLVIGTKRPPASWRPRKKMAKGEFVKKNAPDYCEVTIVHNGMKVVDGQQVTELDHSSLASSSPRRPEVTRHSERNFFECVCFSGLKSRILSTLKAPKTGLHNTHVKHNWQWKGHGPKLLKERECENNLQAEGCKLL